MPRAVSYSHEDWLADGKWIEARQAGDPDAFNSTAVLAYFERKYGPTGAWHMNRLFAALRYFTRHVEEFNEGTFAIAARDGGVIGTNLLFALCSIFSEARDDQLDYDWPVDDVKTIARQIAP